MFPTFSLLSCYSQKALVPILSLSKPENIKIYNTRNEILTKEDVKYLRVASNISIDSLLSIINSCPNIKYLDIIDGNSLNLKTLFNSRTVQEKITHLYIENLDTLTAAIGFLHNLEWLGINNSGLKVLPEEVGQLKKLRILNLGFIYKHFCTANSLTKLPGSLVNLEQLEALYLNKNEFSEIPNFLCSIKNLKIISLIENPINEIPKCFQDVGIKVNIDPK